MMGGEKGRGGRELRDCVFPSFLVTGKGGATG